MKLQKFEVALLLALAAALLVSSSFARRQDELAGKLIRLHVVPHSDGARDQELKLRVRDVALGVAGGALDGAASRDDGLRAVAENLDAIAAAAQSEVAAAGFDYPVAAALTRETFPTRAYDDFTLPAGEYETLRITIGDGTGGNWWCVVYPPLCLDAVSECAAERFGALDGGEARMIAGGDADGTEIRFRVLELLAKVRSWFGK